MSFEFTFSQMCVFRLRPALTVDGVKTTLELRRFLNARRGGNAWRVTVLHHDGSSPRRRICQQYFAVLTEAGFLGGQHQQGAWFRQCGGGR